MIWGTHLLILNSVCNPFLHICKLFSEILLIEKQVYLWPKRKNVEEQSNKKEGKGTGQGSEESEAAEEMEQLFSGEESGALQLRSGRSWDGHFWAPEPFPCSNGVFGRAQD